MDYFPGAGVRYYRLRQRDMDGKIQYSTLISLNSKENAEGEFFRVFPNPASGGDLNIYSSQGYEVGALIRMYGPTGQLVTEQRMTAASTQLDIRGLPSGMYLLSVISGDQSWSEKVILE
jgi:trimeric autotransporter adhesin